MHPPAAFVFGKTPRHGDFVVQGLSTPVEQAWDGFCTRLLARARETWGEAQALHHAQTPIWRFVVPQGPLSETGFAAGALAPSTDRTGRLFALVAGVQGLSGDAGLTRVQAFTGLAEYILWQAIVEDWDTPAIAEAAAAAWAGLADGDPSGDVRLASRVSAGGLWWALDEPLIAESLPDRLFLLQIPVLDESGQ